MNTINFLLNGLGFQNFEDYRFSAFGFITERVVNISVILALIKTLFGVDWLFALGYAMLVVLEWYTGIRAAYLRGERHESRKLGRMLFKVAIYSVLIFILNSFHINSSFPVIQGYELDPFIWLYWVVVFVIIWQLLVSVLENLDAMGFVGARKIINILNVKISRHLDVEEEKI